MPAIKIPGPYEFNFWSNERGEPSHVHVRRDGMNAKFWLRPARTMVATPARAPAQADAMH